MPPPHAMEMAAVVDMESANATKGFLVTTALM